MNEELREFMGDLYLRFDGSSYDICQLRDRFINLYPGVSGQCCSCHTQDYLDHFKALYKEEVERVKAGICVGPDGNFWYTSNKVEAPAIIKSLLATESTSTIQRYIDGV